MRDDQAYIDHRLDDFSVDYYEDEGEDYCDYCDELLDECICGDDGEEEDEDDRI